MQSATAVPVLFNKCWRQFDVSGLRSRKGWFMAGRPEIYSRDKTRGHGSVGALSPDSLAPSQVPHRAAANLGAAGGRDGAGLRAAAQEWSFGANDGRGLMRRPDSSGPREGTGLPGGRCRNLRPELRLVLGRGRGLFRVIGPLQGRGLGVWSD